MYISRYVVLKLASHRIYSLSFLIIIPKKICILYFFCIGRAFKDLLNMLKAVLVHKLILLLYVCGKDVCDGKEVSQGGR